MIGTIVNTIAVIAGSLTGIFAGKKIPKTLRESIINLIGVVTLVIGMKAALKGEDAIVIIISLVLGFIIGHTIDIDKKINSLSERFKKLVRSKNKHFSEGLITAFLIFCIGSLTIVGALQEGTTGDNSMLLSKSVLDGVTSIVLASTFGWGVFFSFIPLFIFQASLTFLAMNLKDFLSATMITGISATGGVIILSLGLNILGLSQTKTSNILPALMLYPIIKQIINMI
ncbi:DUF554 domain-containing protein [Candidatus Woesearchaeota archaeon]|nr:MAG: DUF554 domain-containing protein [Candidatus Woesearchaeota archaeon]